MSRSKYKALKHEIRTIRMAYTDNRFNGTYRQALDICKTLSLQTDEYELIRDWNCMARKTCRFNYSPSCKQKFNNTLNHYKTYGNMCMSCNAFVVDRLNLDPEERRTSSKMYVPEKTIITPNNSQPN